jgi:hypothetical protein
VKMLCVDGPMAGKYLDVPYPCNAVYREHEQLDIAAITEEASREYWRDFVYYCHQFRIISSIVLIGSLIPVEPPEDAVIKYVLTDAAREAIAQ